nr:hypothetical protein [Tanacetum cinerariifolium]
MRLTPFYKAFLVTADVPEIYMQEFWATATVYHHSIRFKMNNKKHIVNLEYFREMLHICLRLPNQTFDELLFEEEILAFLRYLGYSGDIRKITDVNINKLHQPWRSFAAVINKCLNFAYLLWEDFVYQVELKDAKKSNEMYYPRDDQMFTTIKLVSRHQNTQQFDAILPIELTNEDIRNSAAYKEYYATASGAEPPKTKASFRKTQSSSDTIITPPTAAGIRLSTSAKGKQPAKSSKAKDEGTGILPGVSNVPTDESDEEISWKSSDEDDDDEVNDIKEAKDEESFDPIIQTPENSDDEGNDDASLGMNVGGKEGEDAEDDDEELYRDVNINLEVSSQFVISMLNPSPDAGIDSLFELTPLVDVQASTTVAPLTLTAPTLPPLTIPTISQVPQAPTPPTTAPSTFLQDLLNFGSFEHRLKTLEANFSEFVQTSQFARAVSSILEIVERYMDQRMNEAVKVAVQIQSNRLQDKAQAENEEFLNKLDENIQKIIKEQVKEQVKVQVSKILPKIEKIVNEQLEAAVLTRSSNSSKTSYAMAVDLSEMELKKILIKKMESNKSIHRSYEQRNLYKAMVDAYEYDKIILDTYEDTVTLKRRRDDADKDKEPSTRSDRGSKRRREGKEPESTSAPKEKASKTTEKSTEGSKSHQKTASKKKKPPTLDRAWNKTLSATHGSIQPWISDLAKQADSRSSFNELMDTPVDFSAFLINRLKVVTLTPELLAGPTYELMKGSCKSRHVIPFDNFINNDLEYLYGGAFSRKYTTSVTKTKVADYGYINWIEDLFYGSAVNRESARDVYSKRRIIVVTKLQIVKWHDYKHLDWIIVRRDDDKLYKFKEGDFKRLRIQDIEDMLLLLVQGKLINLTVKERFAFNVSLRMFIRSIVIQRRMKDLQLGVESYQKKLNLTKPDMYRSDLKRKEAYTAYSNPRGFIYQNKDKQNRLMRIDELHKFSDGTLNDVRTSLDDRLKGIWMKYLP